MRCKNYAFINNVKRQFNEIIIRKPSEIFESEILSDPMRRIVKKTVLYIDNHAFQKVDDYLNTY